MPDSDDETVFSDRGLSTPPLSPTKTISTSGWTSPRTPASPRKARSCLFFRDVDGDSLIPPRSISPTKHSFANRLAALELSDTHSPTKERRFPPPAVGSLTKYNAEPFDDSPIRRLQYTIRSNNRSVPEPCVEGSHERQSSADGALPTSRETPENESRTLSRGSNRKSSDSTHSESLSASSSSSSLLVLPHTATSPREIPDSPPQIHTPDREHNPNALGRLPLRFLGSPLRPSQWVARGGLLSPRRSVSRSPDRFISSRRPLNIQRESFELNKPANRLQSEERVTRGGTHSADPFSRRLHRSGRMNDELRSLRETHSVITGRVNPSRRGANIGLRRSSYTLGVRQVSPGAVWAVGGSSAVSDTVVGVSTGRGGVLGSGTNAPLYNSMFLSRADPEAELEAYERRLALAFDVDQADKVLKHNSMSSVPNSPSKTPSPGKSSSVISPTRHVWKDNAWIKEGGTTILDAPQLRDDYYCSLLAYSHTAKCLAVGLGNFVHLWSERKGVDTPESLNSLSTNSGSDVQHVTSLAFSSVQGGQAILAVGRADGRLALWSPFDSEPRFNAEQPKPISCVSFRPGVVKRPSLRDRAMMVPTEELLIGDEAGHVYFYSVEWPNETDSAIFGWHGALTLLARMTMHTQQICGLSWSSDGELFATGGNDNVCFLFETKKALKRHADSPEQTTSLDVRQGPNGESVWTVTPGRNNVLAIEPGREKHRWELNAAVKAIAFCPWQRGLLALGGGSNDRCIHFYHTVSGACLATIDCASQITSLIWSTTRREIAATFGFAQPEHPFRVAVFAWPSCEQIVAIPWYDENRALYAIPYPGGPNTGRERGEDGVWSSRAAEEGCIVVAASDAAIRFHEIWTDDRGSLGPGSGLLGGSDILESLHGIEKEGDQTIR